MYKIFFIAAATVAVTVAASLILAYVMDVVPPGEFARSATAIAIAIGALVETPLVVTGTWHYMQDRKRGDDDGKR